MFRTIAGGFSSYRKAIQGAVKEITKKVPEAWPIFAKVDWYVLLYFLTKWKEKYIVGN